MRSERSHQSLSSLMRLLILSVLLAASAAAFSSSNLPKQRRVHQSIAFDGLRDTPQPVEEPLDHDNVTGPPMTRRRPWKLLSRLRKSIPIERKLACFAIAVLTYLRGPTLLGSDPNVAHAGVQVKLSGVKVEATVKDLPPLIVIKPKPAPKPIPAAAKQKTAEKPTTSAKPKPIAAKPPSATKPTTKKPAAPKRTPRPEGTLTTENIRKQFLDSSQFKIGTAVVAAGSGIFVGYTAHRQSKGDEHGDTNGDQSGSSQSRIIREEELRRQREEAFVKEAMRKVKEERAKLETEANNKKSSNPLKETVARIQETLAAKRLGYLEKLPVNYQEGTENRADFLSTSAFFARD
ncbi:expressed unknown protein [Seminavis robusta]|uniref:Transmembrane protein n=1 Tax=Seminavis robusta TaxID=568900 RepID=A0A9N8DTK8_9STRA|nr:expressed unknown protein [Seminavis robusta]|eukprot:Sro347_g122890.1 n/a (348) ;mRNA; r:25398-26441